jgi:hypothetical protein
MTAYTDPTTPLVALSNGPRHGRWFFYRDWLELRASSRRLHHSLYHPASAPRCYLPTEDHATNPDPAITHRYGAARTWRWVEPTQWLRWGREYLTPEELTDHETRSAA